MKKINGLVLSTLTAALLIGCGGGSGGGTAGTTAGTTTEYDVVPERGAIFGAKVTDNAGNSANQLDPTKNVYTFAQKIVFPVTVTGGFIDMDGNIETTDDAISFERETLTSYSNNITPITNYLGDPADTEGYKTKLQTLKTVLNREDITEKELKSLPSDLKKTDIFALTNAIYLVTNDNRITNKNLFGEVFNTLKDSITVTDPIAIAKQLETKVMVTELGKTILPETQVKQKVADLGTASDKLKIADLGRFVSYEGADDWFDDNTLSGDKLTFKPYSYDYNSSTSKSEWTLDEEDGYVTVTKDSTNPYKFSYVDPNTKEEGTFTIISTTKLGNYTDLSKSIAKIEVTKAATELEWDRWDWVNPTDWDNTTQKSTPITNLDELYTYFNKLGKENATVTKESDRVVYTSKDGKEHSYYKLVQENGNYYIEAADLNDVGYIDSEIIYTGSSLDDLIANIKAEAPVFTSDYFGSAVENQTSTTYTAKVSDTLKVTYSLSGTDAKYFNIDSATGVVTFKTAPDYESSAHNYYYNFIVNATNSANKSSIQNVMLYVTNVDETPASTTPTTDVLAFTSDLISNKVFYPNSSTNSKEKFEFYSNGLLHVFHTYNSESGEINEPWYSNNNSGNYAIIEGKLRTYFSGTCYQFEITAKDSEKITVKTSIDYVCNSASSMDEFESTTQFTSLFFTNTVLSNLPATKVTTPTVPTTPVVSQTDSVVYGKRLYFGSGQDTARFFIDGTYQESGLNLNPSNGNYESYNCSGLWKDLGNNKIGVTCQDNGTTEIPDGIVDSNSNEIIFTFNSSNPKSGDSFDITDADGIHTDRIDGLSPLPLQVIVER